MRIFIGFPLSEQLKNSVSHQWPLNLMCGNSEKTSVNGPSTCSRGTAALGMAFLEFSSHFLDFHFLSNVELPETFLGNHSNVAKPASKVSPVPGSRLGNLKCVI